MQIGEFLAQDDCLIGWTGETKENVLKELCGRAAGRLLLDADGLSGEILKREALGSTGIGGGVAIPHARIAELGKPLGVLVRLKKPIDFDAIDGALVDIVFLLLVPAASAGIHLNALAAVARKLRDPATLQALRRAPDGPALYRAVTS